MFTMKSKLKKVSKGVIKARQRVEGLLQSPVLETNPGLQHQLLLLLGVLNDAQTKSLEIRELIEVQPLENLERRKHVASPLPRSDLSTTRPLSAPKELVGSAVEAMEVSHAYPRFTRKGDKLVKIDRSEKKNHEYRHTCTESEFLLILKKITERNLGGKPTRLKDLLPIEGPNGEELKLYKIYSFLDWMKTIGLLSKHGNEGYCLTENSDPERRVRTAFDELVQLK